jgi:formylglycine-generating enzyme
MKWWVAMKIKIYAMIGLIFVLVLASLVYLTQMQTYARNDNATNTPPKLVNAEPMEMVLIPAGDFQMGCDPDHNAGYACHDDELPLHTVFVSEFSIDKYEVTNEQMAVFLNKRNSNICHGFDCIDINDPDSRLSWNGSYYIVKDGYNHHPVVEVTWYGADIYCSENGKRLPTEAEWEKAAHGNSVQAYPWGDQLPDCSLANFYDFFGSGEFCAGDTKPIGSYPEGASPYGVEDMAGNVWEWVSDSYSSDYYLVSPYYNPHGAITNRFMVMRGGSFDNKDESLRTFDRNHHFRLFSSHFNGFRCVAEAESDE